MFKAPFNTIIIVSIALVCMGTIYFASEYLDIPENNVPTPAAQSVAGQSDGSQTPTPEHRPVVVQYVDSTFEGTDRAGSRSEKAEYYAAVSYVNEEESVELSPGQKRLVVTTALGNLSGPSLTVERQMLALVGSTGDRYAPVNEAENSEVLGVQIDADQSVYGFLAFHVPTDFSEGVLEWCPDGAAPCPHPIRAPLP